MWGLVLTTLLVLLPAGTAEILWKKTSFNPHNPLDGFHSTRESGRDSLSVVHDPAGGSDYVLRVFYKKGSYSHSKPNDHKGARFFANPIAPRKSVTLSYDIYFSPDFDFVKGGKLPGLRGGGQGCSGGHHSEDCFSTRFVWQAHGDGEVYAYQTSHQPHNYCQRKDVHCNLQYGNALGRGTWRFTPGKWHNIAQHLTLNTPGHHDGLLKVWYDGHLVYQMHNATLISKPMHIDGLYFSTFFGGSGASWAATRDCYTYYKNFVFSSESLHPVIIG